MIYANATWHHIKQDGTRAEGVRVKALDVDGSGWAHITGKGLWQAMVPESELTRDGQHSATWAAFPVLVIGPSNVSPRYTLVEYTGAPSLGGTPNAHRTGQRVHVRTDKLQAENEGTK